MGTSLENPDITAALDASTNRAFLRLDVEIDIPRDRFIELATLMDAERYSEAEALMLDLRPDALEYLQLFFAKNLRARSKPAPWSTTAAA